MAHPQWLPTRRDVRGIALATALGVVSVAVARALPPSPFVSDVLLGMVFGALVLNTPLRRIFGLELPSAEREPDAYASGLRYVGKWLLRLSIILMGLKVQTRLFGGHELMIVLGVVSVSVPSAFFVAHVLGAWLGIRRPLADLLAAGTMICGASAVNAMAPVAGAHREEQGVAIGVVFLFSVFAMLTFRWAAMTTGLEASPAGLWSGLAVNDLSSAVAVGTQMGGMGGVMAAASKSVRILMLAPMLLTVAFARRASVASGSMKKSITDALPMFLIGYVALAVVRAFGDRAFGGAAGWARVLDGNKLVLDVLMATVSAGIGLHLSLRSIVATSTGALVVSGGTSVFMAAFSLAMIVAVERGALPLAVGIGLGTLAIAFTAHRALCSDAAQLRSLRKRFERGDALTIAEATALLEAAEVDRSLDDALLRRVLVQLVPGIGELIVARKTPLGHGEGCRWVTYWEGKSGWALVAIVREPGTYTPIHAHPHVLFGKAIEGSLEELRFREGDRDGSGKREVELVSRDVLAHNELVITDGLATLHAVRAIGPSASIDLQLRGPESGEPGRRLRVEGLDLAALDVGARVRGVEEIDDRPGHGGEGASVGRWTMME